MVALLGALSLVIASSGAVVIDSFNTADVGRFPSGWKSRGRGTEDRYRVAVEDGNAYLAADAVAAAGQIGLSSLDSRPGGRLSWRWRLWQAPEGGDERNAATNDSGAAVYVVFPGFLGVPRAIKYTWSASLVPGQSFASPRSSLTRVVVLRGPEAPRGVWLDESVDVAADFARLFAAEAPAALGVALQSDANDTASRARADYDDLILQPAVVLVGDSAGAAR